MLVTGKKSILLVDDETIVAANSKIELERLGYIVTIASSGEQAIEIIKLYPELDLILMDIDLGTGIEGIEAAEKILKAKDIPIIFISSHCEQTLVERAEKIHSYGFIEKSASITVLDATIKIALRLYDRLSAQSKSDADSAYKSQNQKIILDNNPVYDAQNESVGLYDAFINADKDMVFIKDEQLRYLVVNDAMASFFKKSKEAMIGKSDQELADDSLIFPCKSSDLKALEAESPFTIIELLGGRYCETTKFPISLANGKKGIVGIIRDITEWKETEKALRESEEEKFANVFKGSPYPVMIIDTTAGLFAEVNDALIRNVEYSREELIGKNAMELGILTPESMARAKSLIEKSSFYSDLEIAIRTKSGKTRLGLATGRLVELNGRPFLIQTIIDITERKAIEDRLRDSEEMYRQLFEAESDAIFLIDNETGNILAANNSATSTYGYSHEEILAKKNTDMSAEPDVTREATKSDENYIPVRWHRKKDGTEFPVEICATRFTFKNRAVHIAAIRDISGRKKAEEVLKASEKKYSAYVDNAPDGVFVTDELGNYVEVNKAACLITGYSKRELLNMSIREILADESLEAGISAFKELSEKGSSKSEVVFKHKNGTKRWWSVDAVKIDTGNAIAFTKDITERKSSETKIKSLLAEKELILKEVHHRIKNNMATISSILSLQSYTISDPSVITAVKNMKSRLHSMGVLYDKLYQSTSFLSLPINEYLSALIDQIVDTFSNNDSVTVNKNIGDFTLDAKILQPLGIIINELLTNIMKYAFTGRNRGSITISATNTGGHVVVSTQDDGIGMPAAVSFDNSTGFGLQLVQALTQQLEGTIRIERENGTTVILEFTV